MRYFIFSLMMMLYSSWATGQEEFSNTLFYDSLLGSPKASIDEVGWIQGYWVGEAFGGPIEEVWSPPLGGAMMCSFRSVVDGKVNFYELLTISEENQTLLLRLKHFSPNLEGWEEKDKTHDFKLVKITPNKVFFNGFTFEKPDEDTLNVYVIFTSKGKKQETKFSYHRVN